MTVADVAHRLKRNPYLVYRWLREGRLRGEKFGYSWLITERELRRFIRDEPERRSRAGMRRSAK
jgi:excisionase family DNA binding protein